MIVNRPAMGECRVACEEHPPFARRLRQFRWRWCGVSDTTTAPPPLPPVCVVGCASWDTLLPIDRYPAEGEYCVVAREIEQPGGTSTNFAVALARLGQPPQFIGMVGDDWRGTALREGLEAVGVRCDTLATRAGQESDRSLITISPTGGRTIFWIKGAILRRGDAVDTARVFAHRLVYLDLVDFDLWDDLLTAYERDHATNADAPMLVGQAVYVAGVLPPVQAMALVRRHHVFIGGAWEWRLLTGERDDAAMLAAIQATMRKGTLHAALVTRGADGCTLVTRENAADIPAFAVEVADTTGAGDAFAAGFAYGLVQGWNAPRAARFANAVGALATRGVGAQASLPTLDEVKTLLMARGMARVSG